MRRHLKKLCTLMAALVMVTFVLAGCGAGQASEPSSSSAAGVTAAGSAQASTPAENANNVDISKKVNLVMYLLGDKPQDADLVYAEMNKIIEKELNATMSVEFLAWSDWEQKYPLVLASGDQCDLIFTGDWAKYVQEATKGAFVEITDEILQKYMPETLKTQEKVSWEQAKINGKIYFVPRNAAQFTGEKLVLIRGDLREKYGLPELKTISDLEAYYDAVAKNEKGIFPYAASQNNDEMRNLTFHQPNNMVGYVGPLLSYYYTYTEGKVPVDQVKMFYDLPEYETWLKMMKSWADRGYWSKNAISNKTTPRDAFENGTSASLVWNSGTLDSAAKTVNKNHPEWKPEMYDINADKIKQRSLYTGDGMAVPVSSQNPERAFMLLDKLKNERELYDLWQYGIEGKHWIPVDDKTWKPGPDQDKYPQAGSCQWGVNNASWMRNEEGANPVLAQLDAAWEKLEVHPAIEGFRFDDSSVKNEVAAMEAVKSKYVPLLELGAADVGKMLPEFRNALVKAGKDKAEKAFYDQLEQYFSTK